MEATDSKLPISSTPLEVGDRITGVGWRDHAGARLALNDDAHAGRVTLLLFATTAKSAGTKRRLAAFAERQEAFDAAGVQTLLVTGDDPEQGAALPEDLPRTFVLVCDPNFATGKALGLQTPGSANFELGVPDWRALILDEAGRIELLLDPGSVEEEVSAAVTHCVERAEVERPTIVTRQPPVLVLPRLISREHCARLIDIWEGSQRFTGGVANSEGQRNQVDRSFKVREDIALGDLEAPAQELFAIFRKRLFPEIRKAFSFHVSRAETLRLGCYDSEAGGLFKAHRDDTAPAVRHRRFAMSLFLNAGEYEGGYLRFPEYGPQLYNPQAGSAVVFSCSLLHDVTPVTSGRRFGLFGFFHGEVEEAARRASKASYEYTLVDRPAKVYSVAEGAPPHKR